MCKSTKKVVRKAVKLSVWESSFLVLGPNGPKSVRQTNFGPFGPKKFGGITNSALLTAARPSLLLNSALCTIPSLLLYSKIYGARTDRLLSIIF